MNEITDIKSIEKLLDGQKILNFKLLSNSFNINCLKIKTNKNYKYIVKYYNNKIPVFNAVKAEKDNLIYMSKLDINFFAKVKNFNNNYLIVNYIDNNNIKPDNTSKDFLESIILIHSKTNEKYGFSFDTQVGGIRHPNKFTNNWPNFFLENRLKLIFELINKNISLPQKINKKIEFLLKKINEFLPKEPRPSLLHGDLWEGNILFKNEKFVGFIDPGSFYGHNEMELAYLRWFNPTFIDRNFIAKYSNYYPIEKDYYNYEPIYQIYYSLMNVYLWNNSYIYDVNDLLKKVKI